MVFGRSRRRQAATVLVMVVFCVTLSYMHFVTDLEWWLSTCQSSPNKTLCMMSAMRHGYRRNLMAATDVDYFGEWNASNLWLMTAVNSSPNNSSSNNRTQPKHNMLFANKTLSQQLPQVLIIGVRKGGTRALLEMLDLHPHVRKASTEVHFFDRDEHYHMGLEWYRQQMPWAPPGSLTVEKSPSYFITPEAPERIWFMNNSIKLILIVRDPVTRLLSDFAQIEETRTMRGRPHRKFEQVALTRDGQVNTQYRALHVSLYAKFLNRWLNVFPRRQLHVVDGDQLIRDPLSQVQRVEKFLNLEPRITPDQFYFNDTKGFYCLRTGAAQHKCLADSKGRRHPVVDPKVISQLRQFFAPHNRKFYAMVGQNLGWPEY